MSTNEPAKWLARLLARPTAHEYMLERFRHLDKLQTQRMQHDKRYSVSIATSAVGQVRNRYTNILPFNYNRVILADERVIRRSIEPGRGDDYINASLIQAPLGIARQYIATQGPIRSTVVDFWRMVVEQDSRLIVCLSPEHEGGMEKCARYWPIHDEPPRRIPVHGGLHLELTTTQPEQIDQNADCIVRHIQASFVDDSDDSAVLATANVTQLQFLGWADFSVPDDTRPVVELSRLADRLQPPGAGPIIVHCSAGCGRTGTFCVVNSGMEYLRMQQDNSPSSDGDLDDGDLVFTIADAFRRQRTTMVQAASQYRFCYRALLDAYELEYGSTLGP